MAQKLELMWIGKNDQLPIESRILLKDKTLSYKKESNSLLDEPIYDNVLVHGDNLLALQSLVHIYEGAVKCIYIDPPYNTGAAFEYYDDNVEHSTWLSLMYQRLKLLRRLLTNDGVIFIQIDDNEQAYLKVICDEIFGRSNFINMISVKAKASSGASGGGEDRRLKKNVEYILIYSKTDEFDSFKPMNERTLLKEYINQRVKEGKNFAYKSVLVEEGTKTFVKEVPAGNGEPIKIYKVNDYVVKSVSQLSREEHIPEFDVYKKYIDRIFTLENAQTSIRGRVKDAVGEEDDYYIAQYVPVTGKNKNKIYEVGFMGRTKRLVSFLRNLVEIDSDGNIYKLDKIGTLWTDMSWSAVSTEGSVDFPKGKKPEFLLKRIIEMCTEPGDIVLDSFLGSGTTIATAHKLKRRWVGVEIGDQAYTHCKTRMDAIINGTDKTGITNLCSWEGGGGYVFYELAPTLIKVDAFGEPVINKNYNGEMLAAAVALHEGFKYSPDENCYWKQSKSNENAYLFVTTAHVSVAMIKEIESQMSEDEFLVVACKSYDKEAASTSNRIKIKKIPQMLLGKCEFGKDDYNLNIVNPPIYYDEEDDSDE